MSRKKNQYILSQDEIQTLIQQSLPDKPEEYRLPDREQILIRTTYRHGLRNNEAITLKKKHLDFENSQLKIRNSKGGKDRKIPIPSDLEPLLKTYAEVLDRDEYLFPSRRSSGHLSQRGFEWLISKYAIEGGLYPEEVDFGDLNEIPYQERIMPHSLRHTYGTNLLQNGVPLERVSKLMGHESIKITADIYGHLNIEDVREDVEQLEKIQL